MAVQFPARLVQGGVFLTNPLQLRNLPGDYRLEAGCFGHSAVVIDNIRIGGSDQDVLGMRYIQWPESM